MILLEASDAGTIWAALIGAAGLILVTVLQIVQGRKLTRTKEAAERAVELSAPTGNGFANDVKQRLTHLSQQLVEVRTEQANQRDDQREARKEHREDMDAVRRDISDLRTGQRDNSTRLGLLERLKHRGESI